MRSWVNGLGSNQQSILRRLSKEAVRNHQNVRDAGQGGPGPSGGSFAAAQAHSHGQNAPGMSFFKKDNKSSQYVTSANIGEPTSNYGSTTAEAKYTPVYQDYAAESSSSYTSASKPAPSHAYRPPSPYRPYSTSNETSGYAPSYAPSYSLPGPPPGPPTYPGFSGAEPAQYGRHHYGHEAGHESWQDDQPEGHHKRREDHHDHSYHHHHHHESSGYTTGGFENEPVPGEPFQPVPETPFSFRDTQPYTGQTPQGSRFSNPPQSDDPNQYGWRY